MGEERGRVITMVCYVFVFDVHLPSSGEVVSGEVWIFWAMMLNLLKSRMCVLAVNVE